MRIQILMPCLILLALCGLLVTQKSDSQKTFARPPAATPRNFAPEKFLPLPALPPPAPEAIAPPACLAPDEIISSLTAEDESTRKTALAAAVQSGDRTYIPALQAAAERTAEAHEKSALLDAAEFLALPTLAEAGH